MPAVSQDQQKLMGMALAVKRGEMPRSKASPEVLKLLKTIKDKDLVAYASTQRKGLPRRVSQRQPQMHVRRARSM